MDTIQLSSGAMLDLTSVSEKISSVEIINMRADTNSNSLALTAQDVFNMSESNLFNTNSGFVNITGSVLSSTVNKYQLLVNGSTNDTVHLESGGWTNRGTVSDGSHTYAVYESGTQYQVLIEEHTQVIG